MAKVLLVDDDPIVRLAIGNQLKAAGYQVVEAENGSQVPALLAQERPAILVTDIIMPDREGIETILAVRDRYPTLPIIAMSVDEQYLDLADKLGANAILHKRFDEANWQQLLGMIEDLLRSH